MVATDQLQLLQRIGCDEDIDPGVESGEHPLPPKFHLHIN